MLVAEIHAAKTILAAFAVVTIIAVGAHDAVAAKVAVIAILNINAFVAEFRFFRESAIHAVAAYAEPKSIITIFRKHVADDEVTIFSAGMVGRICAIFAADGNNARMRPGLPQSLKAIEEIHGSIIAKIRYCAALAAGVALQRHRTPVVVNIGRC